MWDAAFDCSEKRTSNFLVISHKLLAFMEVAELIAIHKKQYAPVKSLFLERACQKWKVIFMPSLDPLRGLPTGQ